jgi:hypothetical protein
VEVGGTWYWVRSPDEEKRVVAGLFNRYCIRCHGQDGRGVWDIPGVPNFTNAAWQSSRSDAQIALIILEGRGAVMPPFRGTLSLEEACAMARYLRTFAPDADKSKPATAQGPESGPQPPAHATVPPAPARYENPSAWSNFLASVNILLFPFSLVVMFGRMLARHPTGTPVLAGLRHAAVIYGVMLLLFVVMIVWAVYWDSLQPNPALADRPAHTLYLRNARGQRLEKAVPALAGLPVDQELATWRARSCASAPPPVPPSRR